MAPPKNGSLGRGLGDLLGGVPDTIGVAGAPTPPPVVPTIQPPSPPMPPIPPVAPPVQPVVTLPGAVKSYWTPAHVIMAFVGGLSFILVGVAIGMWTLSRRKVEPAPARMEPHVVIVTNTVVLPPEPVRIPVVDAAELLSLNSSGVMVVTERNGTARVSFAYPLFSSRVILDPARNSLLDQLGAILGRHAGDWDVRVIGHTDAAAIRGSSLYRDNKELGLARATEVIRYFCRHTAVPASMLTAATAGEDNPPFPGDDPESSRKNRTVTLVIQRK